MTDALPPTLAPTLAQDSRDVAAEVASAAAPASAASTPSMSGRPLLGAASPAAGKMVFSIGGGTAILLPQLTLDARIGLGESTSIDVRYRNLAIFGHFVQGRFTWSTPIGAHLTFGLAARTGIGSLAQADGDKIGVDLSALSLGNSWEVGHDLIFTWTRPRQAHVMASIGPTYALGAPHYTTYDDRKFKFDPYWQSVTASLQGEWEVSPARRLFIRLDGLFLVKADINPYGFLPTLTIGHAWST